MTTKSHKLAAPLELKAAGDDKTALPTRFGGVAYSGALVRQWGMGLVVDLGTTRVKERMPMLAEHDRREGVGVSDMAEIKDNQLIIAGSLFSDMAGSYAERIAQLAQRGMPFEMSIGLFDANEEFVATGKTVAVNGQTFTGPVTVLRDGIVREVSICTLGADAATTAQMFSSQPSGEAMLSIEQLTAQVADLTAQLAAAKSEPALAAARAEGAATERARIQAVEAAALPGHEALIASIKFDGKTSGAEAALAVVAAERALRGTAAAQLAADAPKPVPQAAAAALEAKPGAEDESQPIEDRAKATWEGSPSVRQEFGTLAAYTAFRKADAGGRVRVLRTRAAA